MAYLQKAGIKAHKTIQFTVVCTPWALFILLFNFVDVFEEVFLKKKDKLANAVHKKRKFANISIGLT